MTTVTDRPAPAATTLVSTGPATAPLIRDFPVSERPRERLRHYGAGQLSNAELLAILFRPGMQGENVVAMATRILARFEGLATLSRTSFDELCAEKGLSEAKACQLLAALELGRRVSSLSPEDRVVISSPKDIANLFMAEMSSLEREELRVLLLNTKNQVIGVERLYRGSVNSALVRPAEVSGPMATRWLVKRDDHVCTRDRFQPSFNLIPRHETVTQAYHRKILGQGSTDQ